MRSKYGVALLLAPVIFLAMLMFTADNSLQASPHDDRYYRGDYARSVAVVWALDSIKDGVSCHDSLRRYENEVAGDRYSYDRSYDRGYERRYYRGSAGDYREAIEGTYEDLAGACTDNHPHAGARDQAAFYLAGLKVTR